MKIDKNIELHGNFLRLVFYFRKVKCRECLYLEYSKENIKQAKLLRDDILSDIRRHKFNYATYFPDSPKCKLFEVKPKSYLMRDLFERQITFIRENKTYSKFTKRDYIGYLENYLVPTFGNTLINELKPLDIKSWIMSFNKGPDYVRNLLIQLRATLDDAVNDGLIDRSPLDSIKTSRLFQLLDSETEYEVDPFISQERNLILDSATGEVRNLIQFGLYSGLRIGEILALKWEYVNLIAGKITVEFTMNNGELERPKTPSSKRELLLLSKALEAINDQLKYKNQDGFVFHNPNTGTYWPETDAFRKHWVKILSNVGLKYRNPYQMRHTFASMLISKGENIHKVAKYLGHKNINMVIEIYGKYIPESGNENTFVNNYE